MELGEILSRIDLMRQELIRRGYTKTAAEMGACQIVAAWIQAGPHWQLAKGARVPGTHEESPSQERDARTRYGFGPINNSTEALPIRGRQLSRKEVQVGVREASKSLKQGKP